MSGFSRSQPAPTNPRNEEATMSLAFSLLLPSSIPWLRPQQLPSRRRKLSVCAVPRLRGIRARQRDQELSLSRRSRWEEVLATAASLYPLYVTAGGVIACVKPSAFSWFVARGPGSYSCTLGFIMLAMGLTLDLEDFLSLLVKRPLSILFGCAAQYTIMPVFAAIVSKAMGLSPALSVGLILLGCCPGGTASNVVTLVAQGDVPLSIVMTACTTLSAVILTPLLTKFLAGAIVPVDAVKLSISTMQVVVAPLLLGSYMQKVVPDFVKVVTPYAPLVAVLASSLLASSVFSENIIRLRQSMAAAPNGVELVPSLGLNSFLSRDFGAIIISVILLHILGYFVGYASSAICGFKERQRRAISIEVGMQNASLGVVLASSHFTSPMVSLPCAISAIIMNIMGSSLGLIWRYVDPSDPSDPVTSDSDDSD